MDVKHGVIRGRITNEYGNSISDAIVSIKSGPTHKDIAAMTDQAGVFKFNDLIPGDYELLINKEQQLKTVSVRVSGGETSDISVQY